MQNKVLVEMDGTSPLLMHQFPMKPIEGMAKLTPKEQAEHAAYRDPVTEELYMPGVAVQTALIKAATYSKGKGRASLQKPAAACMIVTPDRIPLNTKEYEVDSRPVVIPATKGRIIRHRPRLDSWKIRFELEWDGTLLSTEQVRQIVDDMGRRVGLLDFRPACNGSFGRSSITRWQENGNGEAD